MSCAHVTMIGARLRGSGGDSVVWTCTSCCMQVPGMPHERVVDSVQDSLLVYGKPLDLSLGMPPAGTIVAMLPIVSSRV